MKKSAIKLIIVLSCFIASESVFAGGSPVIYPTTSTTDAMNPSETMEISGKLAIGNTTGPPDSSDKFLVKGPGDVVKERPIPPIMRRMLVNPGPPSTLFGWEVDGSYVFNLGMDVGINIAVPQQRLHVIGNILASGSMDANQYLINGLPFLQGKWLTNGNDIYYITGYVGIGISQPTVKLDVVGDIKAFDARFDKVITNRLTSQDSLIFIGDSSIIINHNQNNIKASQSGLLSGIGIGESSYGRGTLSAAFGSFCNAFGRESIAIGYTVTTRGRGSLAIGNSVQTDADTAFVIGSGNVDFSIPSFGILKNDIPNSLMIGFNSDTPTLTVRAASGNGASGKVGIGTSNPANRLSVDGIADFTTRVGIGTATPATALHVDGKTAFAADNVVLALGLLTATGVQIHQTTTGSPPPNGEVALIIGDTTARSMLFAPHLGVSYYNGITLDGDLGIIFRNGVGNQGGSGFVLAPQGGTGGIRIAPNGNVGIGTSDPGAFRLAVEGTIGARRVRVTLDAWADHVFSENYSLMPLDQLEVYVEEHKHLPNIPAENEILESGIDLGDMQAKHMEKTEELYRYIFQLNERLKKLEETIMNQQKIIDQFYSEKSK